MAQGTGQARRQNAGTEKSSGTKTPAGSRGNGAARRRQSSASTNGRSQAKSQSTARRSSNASKNGSGAAKKSSSPAATKKTSSAAATKKGSSAAATKKSASAAATRRTASAAAKKTSAAAKKTSGAVASKTEAAAKETKSVARRTKRRTKRAARVAKAGWTVTKAVAPVAKAAMPVVKQLPEIAARARAAAVPVGAAGTGLAAAGLARHTLRRRRQQAPLARRLGQQAASAVTNIRPRRRRRKLPQLPSLPQLPDLPSATDLLAHRQDALWLAAVPVGIEATRRAGRARHLPVQACVDVAVPVHVAYDEWMKLDFLPEGAHRVEEIERGGNGRLTGRVQSPIRSRKWEAEVRDERDCESFAWRSVKGSDCAGLITFHSLSERLTRLELQLDIVPLRPLESVELALHVADVHARSELRRFKGRLEVISPDAYEDD